MSNFVPLIVFAVVIFFVIEQPRVKLPFFSKPLLIDYGLAPVLGIIVLFLAVGLDETVGWNKTKTILVGSIVGNENIRPYSILILFNALAYVCISLDLTGFFAYLALWTTKKAGTSGKKLFIYFFLLSSILTTFTSNDIVILTLTPLICYFTKYTNTDPIPYLIAQFFAANIWSISLYIGNPTNIIVAEAYRLSFAGYSAWMALPTIVAGLSCLALLWVVFCKRIPEVITPPDIEPRSALKDLKGAIFGVFCLATCLVFLCISYWLNMDIWKICLVTCIVMMVRDILCDLTKRNYHFPLLIEAIKRMPWEIVPFVISMFAMVGVLSATGWVSKFAVMVSAMSGNLFNAVVSMAFLSSFASNLMNNQPMTILFTQITQDSAFNVSSGVIRQGTMFALIMGSNFGANFTLIGALAGIMWSNIMSDKHISIAYKEFAKYGILIMPLVVFLACLVLIAELKFFAS